MTSQLRGRKFFLLSLFRVRLRTQVLRATSQYLNSLSNQNGDMRRSGINEFVYVEFDANGIRHFNRRHCRLCFAESESAETTTSFVAIENIYVIVHHENQRRRTKQFMPEPFSKTDSKHVLDGRSLEAARRGRGRHPGQRRPPAKSGLVRDVHESVLTNCEKSRRRK